MASREALIGQAKQLQAQLFQAQMLQAEQFQQLQMLEDPSQPDFFSEVVTLFVQDAEQKINRLAQLVASAGGLAAAQQEIDSVAHQLKGSSASIGAMQVAACCGELRTAAAAGDMPQCQNALQRIQQAYSTLRDQLGQLLGLLVQLRASGGSLEDLL
ncbi:unnamed protein product [Pedinophyceae sp. YPF-701]|nr:unnamed protein product [Pedinophyceae sp. YPF-701]